jgi:hypothetical protein
VVNDPCAAGDLSRIHMGLPISTRDNLDRHGGPQLWDITERLGSAPGAEPVVELGGGDGSGHEAALRLVAAQCRATLWMTTWTPRGVTVGDDGRLGLDPWQEESVASLA